MVVALAAAYAVTVIINVVPAFMPPSWSVLAFFLIKYDLPLLLVTIGGAVASSVGRLGLALASRRWGSRLLSRQRRRKLRRLGVWLDEKPRWAIPLVVLLFALGPIPSNAVFIAAGLTGIRLTPVFVGFFVGRAISYTVLDLATRKVVGDFQNLFIGQFHNPLALALDALMLGAVVIFALIDWPKLLHLPDVSEESEEPERDGHGAGREAEEARGALSRPASPRGGRPRG